jgi:hypothetical protein
MNPNDLIAHRFQHVTVITKGQRGVCDVNIDVKDNRISLNLPPDMLSALGLQLGHSLPFTDEIVEKIRLDESGMPELTL